MHLDKFLKSKLTKHVSVLLIITHMQVFVFGDLSWAMSTASTGSSSSGAASSSQSSPSPMELFQVDTFTGAFSTGVNIFTPPGRKGIEPKITLSYNSSGPNSWLGVGWGLGFGSISRSTKDGVPKYDDDKDTFIMSFQGVSSELVEVSQNQYRTKDEALFLKIEKHSNSWCVTDKGGTKYFFGDNTNSRQETNDGTFAWMFERVVDTNGNYMTISYQHDAGAVYPHEILYTGHIGSDGTEHRPLHKVTFYLDNRADSSIAFNNGSRMEVRKRLRQIDVHVSNDLARRYILEYGYSPFTQRSCLKKVTEIGSGGVSALPPVTFDYEKLGMAFDEQDVWGNIESLGDENLRHIHMSASEGPHDNSSSWTKATVIDMNRDGLPDRVLQDEENGTQWKVQINQGDRFGAYETWGNIDPTKGGWIRKNTGRRVSDENENRTEVDVVDLNGDGFVDRVIDMGGGQWKVQYSTGAGFQDAVIWDGITGVPGANNQIDFRGIRVSKTASSGHQIGLVDLIDMNGDGLLDRVYGSYVDHDITNDWSVQLNTGSGFAAPIPWTGVSQGPKSWIRKQDPNNGPTTLDTFDINGDGLTDRVWNHSDGHWIIQYNNGKSFEKPEVWMSVVSIESYGDTKRRNISYAKRQDGPSDRWITQVDIIDINGDGLPDRLLQDNAYEDHWKIQLNTGSGFRSAQSWNGVRNQPNAWVKMTDSHQDTSNNTGDQKVRIDLFDINGDGLADRVIQEGNTWLVQSCTSQARDLMVHIDNGRGGSSDITYASSNRCDNTGDDDISDLPFPVVTVSKVVSHDGLGNTYPTSYEYEGGYYDTKDREFRGFGHVTVYDPTRIARHFWHYQDDVYKGKVYKEELRSGGGDLYSKTESTWEMLHPEPSFSEIRFVYAKETNNFIYDGDETFKHIKTAFEYDTYGNLQKTIEHGDVDRQGDERTTVNYFAYSHDAYILNALSKTALYDHEGNKCSEKRYYYDGAEDEDTPPVKGNLTKEEEVLSLTMPLGGQGGGALAEGTSDVASGLVGSGAAGPAQTTGNEQNPTTAMAYDDFGNIKTITDANGNTTRNTYDPVYKKFLTQIENALGHTTEFTYSAKYAQILSTTDANGVMERSVYDVFGRLVKSIGPRDTDALPTKEIVYDIRQGKPTRITTHLRIRHGEAPVMTSYAFIDGMGRTIQTRSPSEDPDKQIVTGVIRYNQRGQKEAECYPFLENFSTEYKRPSADLPCTQYAYDEIARLQQTTFADNTTATVSYNDFVTVGIDPNLNKKRTTVDAYGRTILVEEFNEGEIYKTQYIYDCRGNLTQTIDDHGNESTILYDSLSRKIAMDDPDMGHWEYRYDTNGNLTQQTDALNNTITFHYDALNRITLKDYPEGQEDVRYFYDESSLPIRRDQGASYDIGRLTRITDASGTTEMSYDNLGRVDYLRKSIDETVYDFKTTFDALGRKTSVTIIPVSLAHVTSDVAPGLVGSGAAGSPTTIPNPQSPIPGIESSETIQYIYNNQGELEQIKSSKDGLIVKNVDYNASSQMLRAEFGNSTYTTYHYDPQTFRLKNLITRNGKGVLLQDLSYDFDNLGNVNEIRDAVNTASQTFTYDDLNRLIEARGSHYGVKRYAYDSIGNMLKKGSLSLFYGEDSGHRPHAVTRASDGRTFQYDANGSMVQRGEDLLAYDYDQRLTDIRVKKARQKSISYDLKAGWNHISFPVLPEDKSVQNVLSPIWENFDQLSKYDPETNEWIHFVKEEAYAEFTTLDYGVGYQIYITEVPSGPLLVDGKDIPADQTIALKAGENLIGPSILEETNIEDLIQDTNYTEIAKWDPDRQDYVLYTRNEFSTITPGEALTIETSTNSSLRLAKEAKDVSFVYDANGTRVKKITETGTTTYIGENIIIDKTGVFKKHISLNGTKIFTSESDGDKYFTHSDHINSSNIVTNAEGDQTTLIEYTPYGQTSKLEGEDVIDHKFTGHEEDDETDLYYARARYYDANLGRFITADSIVQDPFDPQSFNRYAYARNNPIIFTDPSGHLFFLAAILIGAAVGAATTAVLTGVFGIGVIAASAIGGAIGGAVTGGINGGWKGALIGAGLGFVGGYIGGFIKHQGWDKLGYGLMAASAVYAGVTGGPEGLAGFAAGLAGGIFGYEIGSGIDSYLSDPLLQKLPKQDLLGFEETRILGIRTTDAIAQRTADQLGMRVLYVRTRGFLADMTRASLGKIFGNSQASQDLVKYFVQGGAYFMHSEGTLFGAGALNQMIDVNIKSPNLVLHWHAPAVYQFNAEYLGNAVAATTGSYKLLIQDPVGVVSTANPVKAIVHGVAGVITRFKYHHLEKYNP